MVGPVQGELRRPYLAGIDPALRMPAWAGRAALFTGKSTPNGGTTSADDAMTQKGLWILAILCLGVLIGVVLRNAVDTVPADRADRMAQARGSASGDLASTPRDSDTAGTGLDPVSLEALRVGLDEARLRDQQQEQTLIELQGRLERLEALEDGTPAGAAIEGAGGRVSGPATSGSQAQGEAGLIAAGIDSQTAAWIQQQLDKNQLDELYLRNQSLREGWINTPRFRDALVQLQSRFDALRGEMGDDNFDRLLFALGRNNRVVVSEVMHDSPAQQFGLNAGDTIIRYDGKRVLSTQELQALTAQGDSASPVLVEISREGQSMTLYVSGGPLGVRLMTRRARPE
jgi:hypothetical protein